MENSRKWMYDGWNNNGRHSVEWKEGTKDFIRQAFGSTPVSDMAEVRCPCALCGNSLKRCRAEMEMHLCKNGFKANYYRWIDHGESVQGGSSSSVRVQPSNIVEGYDEIDRMEEMVDNIGQGLDLPQEEVPTPLATDFLKLLKAASEPLHEKTNVTLLAAVARLIAIKSKHNFSTKCYNDLVKLICSLLSEDHKMPRNLYDSKKILSGLGMPYEKINYCPRYCIIFWKEHAKKTHCDRCGESRYVEVTDKDGNTKQTKVAKKTLHYFPMTPRLQRLFMSEETAKHMRWHKEGKRVKEGVMVHPSDGEAWKYFDEMNHDFARDPRNVRIGLATDGFTPFSMSAQSYSCWPVFTIPYNLPPDRCMKEEYMFLSLIIPGPSHPGKHLDLLMQPLMAELRELWTNGVLTYDSSTKQNFRMRAAYMWSIHDFPAYGMFSGWSTHGRLSCPICMDDTGAFQLKNGGKTCFFDCHRRFLSSSHPSRRQPISSPADLVLLLASSN